MNPAAWRDRLREAWAEIRQNPARACLQSLGVILGVASILGGFSISDSTRRQSARLYARLGGLEKLDVWPEAPLRRGAPTALQNANRGLVAAEASKGKALVPEDVEGVSVRRKAKVRITSPSADVEREVTGIGEDYLPLEGYQLDRGRAFTAAELGWGSPLAILGSEAAARFFPDGSAVGQTLTLDGHTVTVVGTFEDRVFRFSREGENLFAGMNRIIALPATFVQRRLQGDPHGRVDHLTFRIPVPGALTDFSRRLGSMLYAGHRQQWDFRLDDVAGRTRRMESQGRIYDLVFLLSGVMALLGSGMVNVNIQLASLKERVREVGLRMALGASGWEIARNFMLEAMLLTAGGTVLGILVGIGFSWMIMNHLGVPMVLGPGSLVWASLMAFLSGFGFALFPAWRASRLSPMEALRHE